MDDNTIIPGSTGYYKFLWEEADNHRKFLIQERIMQKYDDDKKVEAIKELLKIVQSAEMPLDDYQHNAIDRAHKLVN